MIRVKADEMTAAHEWYRSRMSLDLDPPYQRRGGIWNERAKAFLIDSMINGFDLPKFYVADLALMPESFQSREASAPRAVIDGKQRFEAMFEWFRGDLRLDQEFVYFRDPLVEAGGKNCRELAQVHPELTATVESFKLAVMKVVADQESEIRQLFIRLNQGFKLAGAETRNAMEGAAPTVIRNLSEHPLFADRVAFSIQRGGDRNTVAKILLLEFTGEFVDVKRRRLDKFVSDIADEADMADAVPEQLDTAAQAVSDVFDGMAEVFTTKDPLLRTQGQLPVYYWLVREFGPQPELRHFLLEFEHLREENRRLVAERGTSGDIDVELLQYDQFNRSVNDQHSLRGRFEILRRRFARRHR